jgi:predicted type IV restriction endonuclease
MANQIVKALRKFIPIWQEAKEKDLNEADTVTRIIKFLEEALEYDALEHITKEFQVKERYVDLAIKVENKLKFYIEAKAANTSLKESQIFQAESYASQSGVEWVLLTNGAEWQLYHLVFDRTGIEHSLVLCLDLISGEILENADKLYHLSFDAMKKNEIEEYWERHLSLHASSIIRALFHEDTLASIRREIRRKKDILLDEDEVVEGIKKLLDKDVLGQYGDSIKIGRKRRISKDKVEESKEETPQTSSPGVMEQSKNVVEQATTGDNPISIKQ